MTEIRDWLATAAYLPEVMRDHHDAKDLFKALHETVNVEGHLYARSVDWVTGQCYTIDIFLWWMAKHGYVLRKARHKGVPFEDLKITVEGAKDRRAEAFSAILRRSIADYPQTQEQTGAEPRMSEPLPEPR